MKLGLSSYSLVRELKSGRMSIFDVIEWAAAQGCEHVEIVPAGFNIEEPDMPERIRERAREAGVRLSNYAINANFVKDGDDELRQEIDRVKRHVDIASRLGCTRMRHDIAWRTPSSIIQLTDELGRFASACRDIADYASPKGITTSLENHGTYLQASDRIQLLIHAVGRDNFRLTMDVGNFLCADEQPVVAVARNIGLASMIHLKDFHIRSGRRFPGEGWFRSAGGIGLRGAIFGHGDVDTREVLRIIRHSGYDGDLSLEFEGLEDCLTGASIGLHNARAMWQEVQ